MLARENLAQFVESLGYYPSTQQPENGDQSGGANGTFDLADSLEAQFNIETVIPIHHTEESGDSDSHPIDNEFTILFQAAASETSAIAACLVTSEDVLAYKRLISEDELSAIIDEGIGWFRDTETRVQLRYVSLPNHPDEYMVYVQQSNENSNLVLVFDGTAPQLKIYEDANQLIGRIQESQIDYDFQLTWLDHSNGSGELVAQSPQALRNVERYSATFIWVLRNPADILDEKLIKIVHRGIRRFSGEQHWQVRKMRVRATYVYLWVDLPDSVAARHAIDMLREQSSQTICDAMRTPNQMLWSDSYLILTPGRDMPSHEIGEFIEFVRS